MAHVITKAANKVIKISRAYTQREIAEKLGISRSYVSRIEKRIIEQLSADFEK